MPPRYASQTSVGADRSRSEIERMLGRHGATSFLFYSEASHAIVGFRMRDRNIKFTIPLPDPADHRRSAQGRDRSKETIRRIVDQETRQRWRALLLIIRAKLEAIEAGVVSFESEFAAQTVLPNGQTVAEWIEPQISAAYLRGEMPRALLPPPGGTS